MTIEKIKHLNLLKISGDDCATFLQGQLTNDLNTLEGQWHYSGYCNPKGRLLALLQIWRDQQGFFALVEQSLCEATIKRLRMYVMRSKVTIEVVDSAAIYGFDGLASLHNEFPDLVSADTSAGAVNGVSQNGDRWLLKHGQRVMLIDPAGDLVANSKNVGSGEQWLAAQILEGRPRVTKQSYEMFIPQMLNLDVLDGISFKKGCYTGQEIVARMHYLGKLKQRMFVCDISALADPDIDSDPAPDISIGQKIFADRECSKSVGNIVSYVPGGKALLAVLRLDALHDLYLQPNLMLNKASSQPYQLPQNKS